MTEHPPGREGVPFADPAISRRKFLHGVAGAALLCSLEGPTRTVLGRHTSAAFRAQRRKRFAPFESELPIPPVLDPVSTEGGVDRYEITMRPGQQQILEGEPTQILGYEGVFPGPTIKAERDRPVEVVQRNELGTGEDVVVHLHGGVNRPEHDGHPDDVIPPGGEYTYRYPNRQRAATLWYHEHGHGYTAKGVYAGRAGLYLVDDPEERALDLPRGEYDVPLVICDRSFDEDNQLLYPSSFPIDGFYGNTILVNGAVIPRMRVERRLYRFRILNASNARRFELVLSHGAEMIQIGADSGGLFPRPVKRPVISLCPAERADVIIDFREFTPGSELVLRNRVGNEATRRVMRFDVVRGGREEARVPKRLRDPVLWPEVVGERTFTLDFQANPEPEWQINGKGFDHNRIDAEPRLGTAELWHWVNTGPSLHPMHTHLAHFQVVSVGGRKPDRADRQAMKDTVLVGPNETVTVKVLFAGFPGRYVFHCHALEHGDKDMMAQMRVLP